MRKTPVGTAVVQRLAAQSDQMWFYMVAQAQLARTLDDFGPAVQDTLTSEVMATNPYIRRLNIRVGQLPQFQVTSQTAAFGATVSTSYEIATTFFEDAVALVADVNATQPLPGVGNKRGGPEEIYQHRFTESKYTDVPPELIDTLSFIRFRRNSFIHLAEAPSNAFLKLAKTNGLSLNQYWGNSQQPLDFTEADTGDLTEGETVAMVKLLRIVVQRLDEHLASILDASAIVDKVVNELFVDKKSRYAGKTLDKRLRALRTIIQRRYGEAPPDSDLEPHCEW